MSRFKIDLYDYASYPFALYHRERLLMVFPFWRKIEIFQTRAEAVELYDKIKSLPEYLD